MGLVGKRKATLEQGGGHKQQCGVVGVCLAETHLSVQFLDALLKKNGIDSLSSCQCTVKKEKF